MSGYSVEVQKNTPCERGTIMITSYHTSLQNSNSVKSGFKYLGRNCPVCSGKRKDCRESLQTGLIHCRSTDGVIGWHFLGEDNLGFGLWRSQQDTDAWNDERRREYQEKRERERQAELDRSKQSLSAKERDQAIRQIIKQLSLSENDRAILLKRNFLSDDRIANYRSVDQWQKLRFEVSNRLAGTNYKGNGLNNPIKGILVPIPDENGNYTALRLYNPDHINNDYGKYTWLSSAKRELTNKLQNNENPIAVYYPKEITSPYIGLCEGLEFKSAIASDRLGIPMIGFSGSNFTLSPNTLKESLEVIKGNFSQPITIVLFPDAGSVINKNIYPSYLKTLSMLESWGYSVSVAYWEQGYSKEVGDIDEVADLSSIRYISKQDFINLDQDIKQTAETLKNDLIKQLGVFGGLIKKTFNNINRKQSKQPYIPTPEGNPDETIYLKLNEYDLIPPPDQYRGQKIILQTKGLSDEQKSRHRANVYEITARLGYKGLLDTSHCGSGKSYVMGELNPYHFYLEKEGEPQRTRSIIYTSPQPRNPTTVAIEELYTEMPTRHAGYVTDGYKLTPAGNPIRYRPQSDDVAPDMMIGENNCINYKQFLSLRSHGQSTKGLCGSCPFFDQCKKGTGAGYGFLFEMFITLANARNIRCHPLSLSTEMVSNKVVINDEFTISYQPIFKVEITKEQLLEEITQAIAVIPSLSSIAGSIFKLAGLTDPDDAHKKFGYDTQECLKTLGELPENIAEIIAGVQFWEEQENEKLLIPDDDGKYPESKPRWLSTLLTIWNSGDSDKLAGAITANRKISISVKNTDPADLFDAAYFTAYQDATTTPSRLALLLGVQTTDFLWVAEEPPVLDNLTIQPVNIGALCGNDRSEDLQKRIEILRNSDRYKDIPTIEYKKYAHPSDLIHGSDARGSNSFEGKEELAVIGLYRKNMTAVLDEYICLTGRRISIADSDYDFCKYYSDGNFAELIQTLGRNRAARYPKKPFTVTIFDDGLSTQGLENFGYKVAPVMGIEEVCPEASPRGTNLFYRVLLFFEGLVGSVEVKKITQGEVATACNCSIARLKQLSANLQGGWTALKEGIIRLIYIAKGKLDLTAEMNKCGFTQDELSFFYSTYIPLLKGQYGYDPEGTFEEVKVLLDGGILYAEGLPPSQAAWILYVIFRRLINLSDMPAIMAMLVPESEFA